MGLSEYQRKRHFDATPEPSGDPDSVHGPESPPAAEAPSTGESHLRFVVQKHAASRLHYDFRLEMDGTLKSWAVPKGPSLNPSDKRLAMMVEDHPLDYRTFEGTIPEGNYGAGTVMVWDEGTYVVELSPGLAKGELKFTLHGHKLRGSWVLVKTHGLEENSWLLIKHKDECAGDVDVTELDRSVLSDRTMEEIADADSTSQPDLLEPTLAYQVKEPFDNADWLFEVKWDGYRIMAHVKDGQARLLTRSGEDYTARYQLVADELTNLHQGCILDGEMVVVDEHGRSDFGALQSYMKTGQGTLIYYVFDLPFAAGRDLRRLPLTKRKQALGELVAPLDHTRLSDDVVGEGKRFFDLARAQDLEGIMAKRSDSPYRDGQRTRDWIKIKTHLRQEAVVAGFTEPRGGRRHIGALVLGLYDDHGKLHHIGEVGTGFSNRTLSELYQRLEPLESPDSPFTDRIKTDTPAHWMQPKLLAEITFREWTSDGHLRQPVFVGLRDDKPATEARRELPAETTVSPDPPDEKTHTAQSAPPTRTKVEFTHLDKVYWPGEGITKGDLITYYDRIADTILPYLKDRPESLNRHPGGIADDSFFQKNVEKHPSWVKTEPIYSESNHKDINWILCNDRDTLLYLANLGCIELNPWHSRIGSLDRPDYCLLDLDAKTIGYDAVVKVALEAQKLLDELDIPSVPKTSGKTGLHICIPLGARYTYEQSKQFAQIIMNLLHERLPDLTSVERKPDKREHRIYLDYLQNRSGQTMAAPYCVRPVPGATVSTPLNWDEVDDSLDPKAFTIQTIPSRVQQVGDLWAPVLSKGIDLEKILSKMSRGK